MFPFTESRPSIYLFLNISTLLLYWNCCIGVFHVYCMLEFLKLLLVELILSTIQTIGSLDRLTLAEVPVLPEFSSPFIAMTPG